MLFRSYGSALLHSRWCSSRRCSTYSCFRVENIQNTHSCNQGVWILSRIPQKPRPRRWTRTIPRRLGYKAHAKTIAHSTRTIHTIRLPISSMELVPDRLILAFHQDRRARQGFGYAVRRGACITKPGRHPKEGANDLPDPEQRVRELLRASLLERNERPFGENTHTHSHLHITNKNNLFPDLSF